MGRLIKNGVLGVVAACVSLGVVVAPAFASSAWWHLQSTSRPTYLQPGQAKDEVWQLTVQATEGRYVIENSKEELNVLRVDESPHEVQEVLEEMYGSGDVEVTGGPGLEPGIEYGTYEIRFGGGLASQQVAPFTVTRNLTEYLGEDGTVTVKELAEGRPDGEILVTATNLGDESANPATEPIVVSDKLPSGVEAIGIEGVADEGLDKTNSPLACAMGSVTCVFTGTGPNKLVGPYEQIQVRIAVRVKPDARSGEVNEASIAGAGVPDARAKQALVISGSPIPYGVNDYEMRPEEDGGGIDTQAGSHPFQFTTTILFNETFEGQPVSLVKDAFQASSGPDRQPHSVCTMPAPGFPK